MTEKTDPQPLTDEEVEAIRQRESERDDCMECARYEDIQKLLARIRADGRRIELLESALRQVAGIERDVGVHRPCCSRGQRIATSVLAALEDKTK